MEHSRIPSGLQHVSPPTTASSVYSDQPEPQPLYARSGLTTGSTPTSRTSYTPSYMSIPRKPTPTSHFDHNSSSNANPVAPTRSAPAVVEPSAGDTAGALLIAIGGAIVPAILSHIEVLLSRQAFSTIAIAATTTQEAALKQLKMDCYAIIGKLRREMGVETYSHEEWGQSEFESTVNEVIRNGGSLHGVLCCPELTELSEDIDIFELDASALYQSWKSSVAFIHSASKATTKLLLSRSKSLSQAVNGALARKPRGPFFIVANSSTHTPLSQISQAALDALVLQLEATVTPRGLIVGYADTMLIPEPTREDEHHNGHKTPSLRAQSLDGNYDDSFNGAESPTRLYTMWALQDQLGGAE